VCGGAFHSLALAGPQGKVFAFGRSDSGQLGLGQDGLDAGEGGCTRGSILFFLFGGGGFVSCRGGGGVIMRLVSSLV
jgi:hypothetical protein